MTSAPSNQEPSHRQSFKGEVNSRTIVRSLALPSLDKEKFSIPPAFTAAFVYLSSVGSTLTSS